MSWLQVVVLSVLQGLTEFLPVSSSGHLAIASRVFFADDAGASFTAVTQLGTEAGGAGVLRPRHRAHRQGLVRRAFQRRRPQRRLPAGLVRHHRHHPDRRAGAAVQGRNPHGGKESVADRVRAGGVLRGDRGRRVLRSADPRCRAAHLARQRDRRSCPVPGAGARGVPVRRDDQRGPVPRAEPRAGRPIRLPAGDPRGVRLGAVLIARRVPSRR